jgi:hypothetical protein
MPYYKNHGVAGNIPTGEPGCLWQYSAGILRREYRELRYAGYGYYTLHIRHLTQQSGKKHGLMQGWKHSE